MKSKLGFLACSVLLLAGCATMDPNDKVFVIGDMAIVDGHRVSKEEYDVAVANGTVNQFIAQVDARYAAPQPAPAAVATVAPVAVPVAVAGPRAAVCDTVRGYAVYPGDSAVFKCNAGLGQLTRGQLLAQGWRVDMMEKTPVPGQAANDGAPLYVYQLILSR